MVCYRPTLVEELAFQYVISKLYSSYLTNSFTIRASILKVYQDLPNYPHIMYF